MSMSSIRHNRRESGQRKMKTPIVFFLLTVFTLCVSEKYTDRYDDVNIDEVLENRRLLTGYVKCILNQGRCTPEGKELKLHIVDGIQTGCEKCTDKQRKGARQVVNYLRTKETEYWEQIIKTYDPKNEYKEIYEKFLAADD